MIIPRLPYRGPATTRARPVALSRRFPPTLAKFVDRFGLSPISLYTMQEFAEPVVDRVGSVDLSNQNTPTYRQTGDWGRYAIDFDGIDRLGAAASGSHDIATSGQLSLFVHARLPSHGAIAGATNFAGKRAGGVGYMLSYDDTTPEARFVVDDGTEIIASVAGDHSEQWLSYLGCIDKDNDLMSLHTDLGADIDVDISTVGDISNGTTFSLGLTEVPHAGELIGYAAVFDSYLSATDFATLTARTK